jgi:hypothetical protein
VIFKVLGILSALIFLLCDTPYLSDTIKGKIQPHRVMWGVVLLLNIVGFANQYAAGARNSLWLFGAGALMTGAIFLASLKNGVGGYAKLDIFSLAVAIIGIVLWQTFNSPILSVLANVLVAIIALVPAFVKARKYPETENGIAYIGGLTSSLLAAISVGKIELILLLLPITSVLLQVYMVYLLYARPNLLGKNAKA